MDDKLRRKYAEMFISMSYDFLQGGITWETYVSNTEIALRGMQKLISLDDVKAIQEIVGE